MNNNYHTQLSNNDQSLNNLSNNPAYGGFGTPIKHTPNPQTNPQTNPPAANLPYPQYSTQSYPQFGQPMMPNQNKPTSQQMGQQMGQHIAQSNNIPTDPRAPTYKSQHSSRSTDGEIELSDMMPPTHQAPQHQAPHHQAPHLLPSEPMHGVKGTDITQIHGNVRNQRIHNSNAPVDVLKTSEIQHGSINDVTDNSRDMISTMPSKHVKKHTGHHPHANKNTSYLNMSIEYIVIPIYLVIVFIFLVHPKTANLFIKYVPPMRHFKGFIVRGIIFALLYLVFRGILNLLGILGNWNSHEVTRNPREAHRMISHPTHVTHVSSTTPVEEVL